MEDWKGGRLEDRLRQMAKGDQDFVSRLEFSRPIFSFTLFLRFATKPIKHSLIRFINTNKCSVKRVSWYPSPMFLSGLQQLSKMRLQAIPARIFTIDTIIALLKTQEVVVDISKVIQHITKLLILTMVAYLIFVCSACMFVFVPHSLCLLTIRRLRG